MIHDEQDTVVTGKSILKRRLGAVKTTEEPPPGHSDEKCANASKRNVTFKETIMVKNDKNLVVDKPLKLEIVIENWKSRSSKTTPDTVQPDPGIVRRLVDEFSTVENPLTDNLEEDNVEEGGSTKIQTDIPLCKGLETKAMATKISKAKTTSPDHLRNSGRVNGLIKIFNLKSTNVNAEDTGIVNF